MRTLSGWIRLPAVLPCLIGALPVSAQVSSVASLSGAYHFRELLLRTNDTGAILATLSASGTLSFDGNGAFTTSGQQIADAAPATVLAGDGAYSVLPGGFLTLTDPLDPAVTVNARLGDGLLTGAPTEAGPGTFGVFFAIPATTRPQSNATLSGLYHVSSLEFPGGGAANVRDTNFRLTANGAGAFGEFSVTGQAANLGGRLFMQTVAPITYSIAPDGTGAILFPLASALDSTTQLIAGNKSIFVADGGAYFIGGSLDPGGHGLIVGVKAPAETASPGWTGRFFTGGLRFDSGRNRFSSSVGSVNATGDGNPSVATWSRRIRQSDGLFDAATLSTFTLGDDGSGPFLSTPGHLNLAASGDVFSTTGVATSDSLSYELSLGARIPEQSGDGVFLNPNGVLNAASFAPTGYPISPGGFVTLFGTGLAAVTATATSLPFPASLEGVSVAINGSPAPVYAVSPTQISAIVPYAVSGDTAAIAVTVSGSVSNTVQVPLAATAPGIFTLPQNGLGDAAALHLDFTLVNQASPAKPGEIVQVYLTGMGAVDPPVSDGAAAPAVEPLARASAALAVTLGGVRCEVQFAGLAPTLAGLYQLNIEIPEGLGPGPWSLAIQTLDGFTDMADLWVAP